VHAVDVTRGETVAGGARGNQCPLGVTNSTTDVGPTLALDVPTATQKSLSVQPTFVRGTEILRAGVPFTRGIVATFAVPQLARTSAATANVATSRQRIGTRIGATLMSPR
jgi:hypothetical protein